MKRSKATSKGATALVLDVNEALKLKQELNKGQAPSQQELLHVLQADKTCDSVCKGKKDNTNCLHGLVPAVGSLRRKGLWQKEPQGLMHLGADPAALRRQVCVATMHPVMHLLVISTSAKRSVENTCHSWSVMLCILAQDSKLPCGLNNLGNTCYVNSALQCLFMTTIFRNAVYQVAPPAADDVILGHIR